jgi:hypothetical protein
MAGQGLALQRLLLAVPLAVLLAVLLAVPLAVLLAVLLAVPLAVLLVGVVVRAAEESRSSAAACAATCALCTDCHEISPATTLTSSAAILDDRTAAFAPSALLPTTESCMLALLLTAGAADLAPVAAVLAALVRLAWPVATGHCWHTQHSQQLHCHCHQLLLHLRRVPGLLHSRPTDLLAVSHQHLLSLGQHCWQVLVTGLHLHGRECARLDAVSTSPIKQLHSH